MKNTETGFGINHITIVPANFEREEENKEKS